MEKLVEIAEMVEELKAQLNDEEVGKLLAILSPKEVLKLQKQIEKIWGLKRGIKWSEWVDTKTGKVKKTVPASQLKKIKAYYRMSALRYRLNRHMYERLERVPAEFAQILQKEMREAIIEQGIENNLDKDAVFALIEKARVKVNKKIVAATKELYASFNEKQYLKSMKARPKFLPVPSALATKARHLREQKNADHQG
jgi:hypothetical protein